MGQNEIDAIRALLGSKPRPIGWLERRQRLDEVGSVWPVASDVSLEAVNCDGVPGEWSLASGSDNVPGTDILPWRLLLRFDPESPPDGDRSGRAARMRTLAIGYRLAPEHPYPAAHEDAMTAWRFVRRQGIPADRIAVGGDSAGGNLAITLINRLGAAS